jgi:DNA repair exonuclease SbcCD ATPase subunit|mmetsp:Transcript_12574/g.20751  ORF Transcript_12574/g.20751 Transcript_12574/m.20751 type:complete len:688 (+) Transcript_12574:89-2152(+)
MKLSFVLLLVAGAVAEEVNPMGQTLQMLADLEAKILAEGADAQKIYNEYAEFCEDSAQNLGFEIKTGRSQVAELKATIEEKTAAITSLNSKIEDYSSDISSDEADLKAATVIRKKEAADFAVEEKETKEVIDALERAISILSKELAKADSTSMLQLKSANSITQVFSVMVQAAAMSADDASKLTALVQESSNQNAEDDDDDDDMGAPASAVYKGHSSPIIQTLQGLLEKAETQLGKARKAESTSKHNYEMLKQSLVDEIKFATKDMTEAKTSLAANQETKSVAEGDLEVTSKDLKEDIKAKADLHHNCMTAAQEFEAATVSRGEELKALATAKKVLQETSGGATEQTYDLAQTSFVQVKSQSGIPGFQAVRSIRKLANKYQSAALAQLASRVNAAMRLGDADGADPFKKVKALIVDMLATLESEAEAEATEKAYCDKEMSETLAKKDDSSAEVEKLTTRINQRKARSTKLKAQVSTLQKELGELAKSMAEATKLRQEEKAAYDKNKAEMDLGLKGVKTALKVLKDYYSKDDEKAHDAAEGAGSSIIGLLEVIESDFTKGIAELVAEEDTSKSDYDSMAKENEIETAKKDEDVKYKTQEYKALDKAVAELSNDLSGEQARLDAILEYDAQIKQRCVAKAEPYEERKKRREDEIAGLKEALETLQGLEDVSLFQRSSRRTLRGIKNHKA